MSPYQTSGYKLALWGHIHKLRSSLHQTMSDIRPKTTLVLDPLEWWFDVICFSPPARWGFLILTKVQLLLLPPLFLLRLPLVVVISASCHVSLVFPSHSASSGCSWARLKHYRELLRQLCTPGPEPYRQLWMQLGMPGPEHMLDRMPDRMLE